MSVMWILMADSKSTELDQLRLENSRLIALLAER